MPEKRRPATGPSNQRSGTQRAGGTGRPGQNRFANGRRSDRPNPQNKPAGARPPKPAPKPERPAEPEVPFFEKPDYLVIAEVATPFGLRGAVKATILTDFPDRFDVLDEVFIAPPGADPHAPRERRGLLSVRPQNDRQVIIRFEGITKIEQAEPLRGYTIAIPVTEAMPLPEGEYYIYQIIGLEVYSTEGQYVGKVVNVERLPASDIYSVRGPLSPKDVLIPAVKDIVKEINLEANRMTIELLEGFI